MLILCHHLEREGERVCVIEREIIHVCMCVRETDRERERDGERVWQKVS